MVTTPAKTAIEDQADLPKAQVPSWPLEPSALNSSPTPEHSAHSQELRPLGGDALQALLAFSAMHQQVRQRRALASQHQGFETVPATAEFEAQEQFVLDEVLQLVAERAIAITGADGLGIALAENEEIVLRASAGTIKPDVGARIQRDSAFSGACFRTAQIIRCDDTETDDRVNLYACRQLGARSMVAVPLCGRRRVIGLLEAFSVEPFGFNDSDVTSLELLAELVLAALKPEDEDRFAESAQAAEAKLITPTVTGSTDVAPKMTESKVAAGKIAASNPPAAASNVLAPLKVSVAVEERSAIAGESAVAIETEAGKLAESKVISESATKAAPSAARSTTRHPGMGLVLALVVVSALLGGVLWWDLNHSPFMQLAANMVAKPEPAAKQSPATATSAVSSGASSSSPAQSSATSSSTAPASAVPSSASSDGQTNSLTNSDVSGDRSAATSPADESVSEESSKMARVAGIRHWSSADSSTVVLDLGDQVQYEAHRLANPDRIYFDLHDTSLASELEGKTIEIGDGLLARARVAQPVAGLTRLVLETKGDSNYSVSLEPNPYRLVVQVTRIGAAPKAQVNLFPGTEQPKLAIVVPPPTKEDLQLRAHVPKLRIVVDAGHGGWDLGTVGRRGLLEKDLVLEIAQRLGKLLQSRLGAEVILTRNDDNYIPLDERAEMANHAQADLFISVHANYSDLPSARGVETYYTNLFSPPDAKDLEVRTNAASSKPATIASLTAAELVDKIQQSRRLAASVQRSLYGALAAKNPGLRDRGVKEQSYVVLTETKMPGILAEVSFVSSPTDEQKLRSDGYREQIAEALYKGIARYAASSRGVKLASAAK
jgi:N-acetylmuramoyl-L-alanine amidase/putative methionine-R-sulfoxide reductase with GAF domain